MSLHGFYQKKAISELFHVIGKSRFPRELDDRGIPVIQGRDIARSLQSVDDLEKFRRPEPGTNLRIAQARDIVLQRIGQYPKSILIGEELQGCVVGDTAIILRPKTDETPEREVIQFLSSNPGKRAIATLTTVGVVPGLSIAALSTLEVLILPADLSRELEESEKDEERVRTFADGLLSKREDLFLADSREVFEERLEDLRKLRAVVASGLFVAEDFRYQLRNFYPLPLAYPYRLIESEIQQLGMPLVRVRASNGGGCIAHWSSGARTRSWCSW